MVAEYEHPALARPRPVVESCWLCGTRLPIAHLVVDGGDGCDSVRWYCADVRACTERWTSRRKKPDPARHDSQASLKARAAAGN
jgi:hypothetical protein